MHENINLQSIFSVRCKLVVILLIIEPSLKHMQNLEFSSNSAVQCKLLYTFGLPMYSLYFSYRKRSNITSYIVYIKY